MTEESDLARIIKNELGGRGYVINVDTRREGDYLVGSLHVTSAETDETVAKVVGVGNVENMRVSFGIDAEGTVRDLIFKALTTFQGMQGMIPSFVVKTPKP